MADGRAVLTSSSPSCAEEHAARLKAEAEALNNSRKLIVAQEQLLESAIQKVRF